MVSDAQALLKPGKRLADRYLIERGLGCGGMGQVFIGRDERFERLLAEVRAQLGKRQDAEQVARQAVEAARASGNAPELSSAEQTLRRVSGSYEALEQSALDEIAKHTKKG
jgi:hypothetical protein